VEETVAVLWSHQQTSVVDRCITASLQLTVTSQ